MDQSFSQTSVVIYQPNNNNSNTLIPTPNMIQDIRRELEISARISSDFSDEKTWKISFYLLEKNYRFDFNRPQT